VTGYEIIFLWVSRMIMLGLKFRGEVPFRDVYIHGIVRDADHQKMSKSKGNVVDPLEICDKYGTDAVRFGLLRMAGLGSDIAFDESQIEPYRAFATKIWNAARLVFIHVEPGDRLPTAAELGAGDLSLADRWILSRLMKAVDESNRALDQYLLHEAGRAVYQFFWSEFCAWYLELIKLDPERSKPTLTFVFEAALRLLHPFMPFITEELWQNMPHAGESIVIAPFPEVVPSLIDERAETRMAAVQDIVAKVRNIRAEKNVDAKAKIPLRIAATDADAQELLSAAREYVFKLAGVGTLDVVSALFGGAAAVQAVAAGFPMEVPLEGLFDVAAERARLGTNLEKVKKEIDGLDRKLSTPSFVERAPQAVVEENRKRLADYRDQEAKLLSAISRL
jgi:valyl-tRNA synthetase